jgi:hypothetical protein
VRPLSQENAQRLAEELTLVNEAIKDLRGSWNMNVRSLGNDTCVETLAALRTEKHVLEFKLNALQRYLTE